MMKRSVIILLLALAACGDPTAPCPKKSSCNEGTCCHDNVCTPCCVP